MNFEKYRSVFLKQALERGYQRSEVDSLLVYAKVLFDKNLPIIYDQEHLSLLLGYDYDYLLALCNSQTMFYKQYEIPKKNGAKRLILEPFPNLKDIQTWILKSILEPASVKMVSPQAKAFMPGKKLRDNARFHRNTNVVVALDIHDFFGSVKEKYIYNVFCTMGYKMPVVVMLTKLCTLNGFLPQGAPTSPMLSNMVFSNIDNKIFKYSRKRSIRYTRYADDMTFSGKEIDVENLIRYIRSLIGHKQFVLNEEKTKVMRRGCRQIVTGVVVNKVLQVPKKYRDKVRQEVYYSMKYGFTSHMRSIELPSWISTVEVYKHHLLGKVNYILQINPKDTEFLRYRDWLRA